MSQERPGRGRSRRAWTAILEATRDELAQTGYDRLSIDRVAARAHVGKQTIYRWYASKNVLVADCILHGYVIPLTLTIASTDDVHHDVAAWLDEFAAESRKPLSAALIRAATAAAAEDAAIAARYSEITRSAELAVADRLQIGIDRGQLVRDMHAGSTAEIIMGALIYQVLAHREITSDFVAQLLHSLRLDGDLHRLGRGQAPSAS